LLNFARTGSQCSHTTLEGISSSVAHTSSSACHCCLCKQCSVKNRGRKFAIHQSKERLRASNPACLYAGGRSKFDRPEHKCWRCVPVHLAVEAQQKVNLCSFTETLGKKDRTNSGCSLHNCSSNVATWMKSNYCSQPLRKAASHYVHTRAVQFKVRPKV